MIYLQGGKPISLRDMARQARDLARYHPDIKDKELRQFLMDCGDVFEKFALLGEMLDSKEHPETI